MGDPEGYYHPKTEGVLCLKGDVYKDHFPDGNPYPGESSAREAVGTDWKDEEEFLQHIRMIDQLPTFSRQGGENQLRTTLH